MLNKCRLFLYILYIYIFLHDSFFQAVQVSGLIVSAQFWPTFKKEDLTLPGPVQTALEKYTKAFEAIKGNRTLEWQKHIGTVKLEIEHAGTTVNFSVSPIQATIIYHFQEKGMYLH